MGKLLARESRINAVIGPGGCSSACEVTGYLSGGQEIPQISWGCTSPTLSDKEDYKFFSRTISPETSKGPALIMFMKHFKWTRAAMLTSTSSIEFKSGLQLTDQLANASIEILKVAPFEPGKFDAAVKKNDIMLLIKRSGIRITILLAGSRDAVAVASQAQRQEMAASGWAWIWLDGSGTDQDSCMLGWLYMRRTHLEDADGQQEFMEKTWEAEDPLWMNHVRKHNKEDLQAAHDAMTVEQVLYTQALHDAIML